MTLRVAHIIGGLSIGGAERNLVNLLNALPCDYRAVIFIGAKHSGPSLHQDLDPAIEQHSIRIRQRNLPVGIAKLASLLRKIGVDVVHTHMFVPNLYGAMAARLAGVPIVVTSEHGENPRKKPLQRWLERRVISPLVDLRFCVSPQILDQRRYMDGVPASKLRLTFNGTPVPSPQTQRSLNLLPVIGSVGRFITAKDYPGLLEAVAKLRSHGYRAEVCIIGDGAEMENIRGTIKKLNLGDIVTLPGLVKDVDRWYEHFDIYVSSSVREGQPVALLEAMAHGLPVVATDVGAMAETVRHGEGGLIVPPGDSAALATALSRLLDDADLRETLGRNALARVEREYSVKSVADFHMKIYRELFLKKRAAQSTAQP